VVGARTLRPMHGSINENRVTDRSRCGDETNP
jgi:hypothetical protein